jgi:hypothetical protein
MHSTAPTTLLLAAYRGTSELGYRVSGSQILRPARTSLIQRSSANTTPRPCDRPYDIHNGDAARPAHSIHRSEYRVCGDWFMTTHYPRFVQVVQQAGFTPSVYFNISDTQADYLAVGYVDATYRELDGHRSKYWLYRTLHFMHDNSLALPNNRGVPFIKWLVYAIDVYTPMAYLALWSLSRHRSFQSR